MGNYWQKVKHLITKFSIQEISTQLLSIPQCAGNTTGLIMVQIDGLSKNQFQAALNSSKLPFIRKLLQNQHFILHSLYSGLPSSTPAVQAELFYGVKCAVPAFGFFNRRYGILGNMLSSQVARNVQSFLEVKGYNLLKGGSAYSDILTGGAQKALFCSSNFGFESVWHRKKIINLLIMMLFHWLLFFKILLLLALEFFLAIFDSFRGILKHQRFISEIIFIPSRVAACVLLRELIVAGVSKDTNRGYPIIHCNFIGYDEQSHRRGPDSAFAHWTLRGIDDAVRRIAKSAENSTKRKYLILIYSDHGQEKVKSYSAEFGRTIFEALSDVLDRQIKTDKKDFYTGIQKKRAFLLGSRFFKTSEVIKPELQKNHIIFSSVGPLVHLYFNESLDTKTKRELATLIVKKAHIPSVLFSDIMGNVLAVTPRGCFRVKEQAAELLGKHHPFLNEVTIDLIHLVHHPNAGDLICSGWKSSGVPLSFPQENGAHAGPGSEETHAFALTPPQIAVPYTRSGYIRPNQLRKAIIAFLQKQKK